jgi:hypothetical protein
MPPPLLTAVLPERVLALTVTSLRLPTRTAAPESRAELLEKVLPEIVRLP